MNKIDELEQQIAELPQGYVVKKTINSKVYYYLQHTENGKSRGQIIKEDQVNEYKTLIDKRCSLKKELKELKKTPKVKKSSLLSSIEFSSHVIYGEELKDYIQTVTKFQKRDCYSIVEKYINSEPADKVCVVYGLRRTGKTTLLKQIMLSFDSEQFAKTAYIKVRADETMASINQDIKKLKEVGIKYLFIDEVTLIKDFIDGAALFSDVYAPQGIKIVLSGTDSLGFWFASGDELYDRAVMVHTTFIPYREHARLLGIKSIDEYIQYGGTLKAGELDFEDDDLNLEESSFRDDESTRRYIDTAICKNIQHSLSCYQDGRYYRHLKDLYRADELTNAINRIIESLNHEFTVQVITDAFKSHDLHSASQMLRNAKKEEDRTDILDMIDTSRILDTLKKILDIKEKDNQGIGITDVHVQEIKEYLRALDLIESNEIRTMYNQANTLEYVIFTQPGMRYCQAQALVYSLLKDEQISSLEERVKVLITDKILNDVRGRMLEDIVIYETQRSMKAIRNNSKQLFKLRFENAEIDMIIYNRETNTCELYEIKHSSQKVEGQYRHLIDVDRNTQIEKLYGKITKRCVLYTGQNAIADNGVIFKNVEEYLCEFD